MIEEEFEISTRKEFNNFIEELINTKFQNILRKVHLTYTRADNTPKSSQELSDKLKEVWTKLHDPEVCFSYHDVNRDDSLKSSDLMFANLKGQYYLISEKGYNLSNGVIECYSHNKNYSLMFVDAKDNKYLITLNVSKIDNTTTKTEDREGKNIVDYLNQSKFLNKISGRHIS